MRASDALDRAALARHLAAAVREAGALALKSFKVPVKSWIKSGNSPVSEADIAVDALLRERLDAAGLACGWLSEETEDDPARLTADQVWIVDPIDGTRAFLAGLPDWSISVALAEAGRPILAAIFAPVTDELYLATAGGGATCNDRPITATAGASLRGRPRRRTQAASRRGWRRSADARRGAEGAFAGAAPRLGRARPARRRLRGTQQPRLGPCGGRSFGARSRRGADHVGGETS